ncbi:hypothetical protein KCP75_00405 [Salmonella enterica subsp. enterica]|nr:hypothetical protein KCP75_00405 [Salmonella enterica subsp. enterica]
MLDRADFLPEFIWRRYLAGTRERRFSEFYQRSIELNCSAEQARHDSRDQPPPSFARWFCGRTEQLAPSATRIAGWITAPEARRRL